MNIKKNWKDPTIEVICVVSNTKAGVSGPLNDGDNTVSGNPS